MTHAGILVPSGSIWFPWARHHCVFRSTDAEKTWTMDYGRLAQRWEHPEVLRFTSKLLESSLIKIQSYRTSGSVRLDPYTAYHQPCVSLLDEGR